MGHSKLKSKVMHLNKKHVEDLKTYLENAKGNTISISSWSKNWTYTHGETRSSSKLTYYIGGQLNSDGHYITCLFVWTFKSSYKPISNDDDAISTQKDWGTEKPDMSEVLKAYKEMYDVEVTPPTSSDDEAEEE
ncbi:hypothetical protein DER45DRAFT_93764 [Fusarium avenaceum]|nr:hypothetical protein DER45DRAFT_93764 [Fusarium avenaceum]